MTSSEVLVLELVAKDRLATSAITSGEVTTLGHEAWDDSVELGSLEVKGLALGAHALFTSAESAEVLSSLWNTCAVQSDRNSLGCSATDGDVEENVSHIVSDFLELKIKIINQIFYPILNKVCKNNYFGVLGFWGFGVLENMTR